MTPHEMLIRHIAGVEGADTVGFKKAMRQLFASDEDFRDFSGDELGAALQFLPDAYRLWREPGTIDIYEVVDKSPLTKAKVERILLLFDVLDAAGYYLRLHVIRIDGTRGPINLSVLWMLWLDYDEWGKTPFSDLLLCAQYGTPAPKIQSVIEQMGLPRG